MIKRRFRVGRDGHGIFLDVLQKYPVVILTGHLSFNVKLKPLNVFRCTRVYKVFTLNDEYLSTYHFNRCSFC